MPHTKLVFVKLMLQLADDPRFIMELNDSQKLDYLLLLLMAGLTHNEIPDNQEWFKSRFHLQKNSVEISTNIAKIMKVFKRVVKYRGKYKFSKFKELHNYIYKEKENSLGILKEFYRNAPNKVNLFLIISNVISYYIDLKEFNPTLIDLPERNRYGKRIKDLLVKSKGDDNLVKEAIKWVSEKEYVDWTLETVSKKWPDFMKEHSKPEILKEWGKK